MEVDWQPPLRTGSRRYRPDGQLRRPRSHNGCLTCKRRKVRCNEERPRCGHCDRLDIRCEWKDSGRLSRRSSNIASNSSPEDTGTGMRDTVLAAELPFMFEAQSETRSPLTELFGFASSIVDPANDLSLFRDVGQLDLQNFLSPSFGAPDGAAMSNAQHCDARGSSAMQNEVLPSERPLSDGLDMVAPPPILEMVENGPRWTSARALLGAMARASLMVRDSVMAFVALQLQRSESRALDHRSFYNKAARELSRRTEESGDGTPAIGDDLKFVLTTIFLLSYIDLLTDRVDLAYSHLRLAYKAVHWSEKGGLGPVEQRVISWIRIVDACAASAGGEGCFVNDQSGVYSPGDSQACYTTVSSNMKESGTPSIEEVLYDMLSGPGALFFQEVQSITGRITKIDHYHRSRGTVQDETEVMAIAAEIQQDLAALYEQRPALMDHAFAGDIGNNLLSPGLTKAIICSYRTYLASFHGCYIHIHRVAHRHLPRPQELSGSLTAMRELMHSMAASCETLPVNVLWPLFLWGCEEDDPEQCKWIVRTIRSLGHVATNANITADLLQEVQARQQGCKGRVDVRTVTVELFKANFAIV